MGEDNSMTNILSRSFGIEPKCHCKSNTELLTLFDNLFPIPYSLSELLDHLPNFLHGWYASDFHVADEGFHTGQVAATTKGREICWSCWASYVAPMGVDPFLQDTLFPITVCLLAGFAG